MPNERARERHAEQIERVDLMANGDDQWDLSDNDCEALKTVLREREALLAACKRASVKLHAYVGVCKDDKELPKIIEMCGAAVVLAEKGPHA